MSSQTALPLEAVTTPAVAETARDDGNYLVWFRRIPSPLRQPLGAITWIVQVILGILTLLVLLAILAAVPVVNLLALGYLLEVEGSVARSGKVRSAFPLLPVAMRLGSILIGVIACLLPVMYFANLAADARLIAPGSVAAGFWLATLLIILIAVAVYILLALARGGSPTCFLRPIKNVRWLRKQLQSGEYWPRVALLQQNLLAALRPRHHLTLGIFGFLGTWVWLALPTALYGAWWQSHSTWSQVLTLVVGAAMIPVLAWLPLLQVRLAVENRWQAMFEVGPIRELFRRSPLCWVLAIAALYGLSIPLFFYSLQIRLHIPLHLGFWWDLTFISIACTFPARAALGWAYHRSQGRKSAWWGWVWFCRLLLGGLLALYVWLLFFTPLTHDAERWQLEHHSLVLPIPF